MADLLAFDDPGVQELMAGRYGDYLAGIGGEEYRHKVLDYVDAEDSPRSLRFQFELVRSLGFRDYDVLHRNSVFGDAHESATDPQIAK